MKPKMPNAHFPVMFVNAVDAVRGRELISVDGIRTLNDDEGNDTRSRNSRASGSRESGESTSGRVRVKEVSDQRDL